MASRNITISSDGRIYLPDNVQMNPFEIATLFGVYVQTIKSNIKAILKSGAIKVDGSGAVSVDGSVLLPDSYGLDMITALAFRIHSPKAELLREWAIRRITANPLPAKLIIQLSDKIVYN